MNFEDQLREAAAEANRIIMSNLPEPEECVHEFSPKFERNIKRMTRRVETPVRYHLQWAACVVLMLATLVGTYVVAATDVGAQFRGWVKEQYETWVHHFFEGDNTEAPTQDFEYRPTWLPEGYQEYSLHTQPSGVMIIYKNDDGMSIRFHYTTNAESRNLYVDGDDLVEFPVQVNDRDAKIYESPDDETAPNIIWMSDDDSVLFIISGYVGHDELVKIAESVE